VLFIVLSVSNKVKIKMYKTIILYEVLWKLNSGFLFEGHQRFNLLEKKLRRKYSNLEETK
jgi:hypothetical protein